MSGLGHIGEMQIINHLKRIKKFAIYLPLKDVGLDFVATKGSDFYQFQIKTSAYQKNSYFWFDLHKNKMIYSKNTFYIFVCFTMPRRNFMGKSQNFLVIPSLQIKEWINRRKLSLKRGTNDIFNLFVYPDLENKKWTYKNKGAEIDLSNFWNNFSCLEN